MDVVNHGGKCCGIKTIRGFPFDPQTKIIERPAKGSVHADGQPDIVGAADNVGKTFHRPALPAETAIERLDRLIEYVRSERPSHMIEAVLNNWQIPYWKTSLRSRGFRLVTSYANSNTEARIYVFHKVIHKGKDVSAKDAAKAIKGV